MFPRAGSSAMRGRRAAFAAVAAPVIEPSIGSPLAEGGLQQ
jgi:hypothetical protein